MRELDRKRPYGSILPAWSGPGGQFDRNAHFSQDGRYYDGQGLEIVVGQPLKRKPPAPVSPRKGDRAPDGNLSAPSDADAIRSPLELIERHAQLPLRKLRERAEVILASLDLPCPKSREAILEALLEATETHRRSHE
jgi:hypothetical protein